jgi:hypothetical protein
LGEEGLHVKSGKVLEPDEPIFGVRRGAFKYKGKNTK